MNPKCHRKIEEPILLNNLSTAPAEQYYACPHCFIKLGADAENDQDVTVESTLGPPAHPVLEKIKVSGPRLLEKVKGLIPGSPGPQEEKEEMEKKEEPPVKSPDKEEEGPSGCPHHFGYLAVRPKDTPIPQGCLVCRKIVDCMLKLGASR